MKSANIQTAVVTGASSGIGARAVQRLRASGAKVLATDISDKLHQIYEGDQGVHTVTGDITDEGLAGEIIDQAQKRFGSIDRLVHCAGIMPGGPIREVNADAALRVMRINYGGTVRTIEAVLPAMREAGRGQIVVLGSLTGYVPTQKFAAYSASKSAVNAYVETLAREERQSGVQVLLAAPTAVKTPLLAQATGGPEFVQRLNKRSSSALMINPDDVLNSIERGLARGKTVVTPGGGAAYLARRLSPSLSWWVTDRIG